MNLLEKKLARSSEFGGTPVVKGGDLRFESPRGQLRLGTRQGHSPWKLIKGSNQQATLTVPRYKVSGSEATQTSTRGGVFLQRPFAGPLRDFSASWRQIRSRRDGWPPWHTQARALFTRRRCVGPRFQIDQGATEEWVERKTSPRGLSSIDDSPFPDRR